MKPRTRRPTATKIISFLLLCCLIFSDFTSFNQHLRRTSTRSKQQQSISSTTAITNLNADGAGPPADFCSNDPSAVRPFLSQDEARKIIGDYFLDVKPNGPKLNLNAVLLHLLEEATKRDMILLTLQIGGNDGKQNDPMYTALIKSNTKNLTLDHWMPVVVEPVVNNFVGLENTYQELKDQRGLKCTYLVRWAMAYGDQVDGNNKTCTFYRFNENSPKVCQDKPDWKKSQVGTLTPDALHNLFVGELYDLCIIPDKVPCGSVADLFASIGLEWALDSVGMIQIDIEGYEEVVLPAFLRESQERGFGLPPILNYESRILAARDERSNTKVMAEIRTMLRTRGFKVYPGRDDDLAIFGIDQPATS